MRSWLALVERAEAFRDARSFGIWLGRSYEERFREDAGIYNYDYDDDERGRPLRYRMMVDKTFHDYIDTMMPEINRRGWHVTVDLKRGRNRWQLVFEPELSGRTSRGRVFWHLVPRAKLDAVLQNGLVPGQSRHGFQYPQPRIYLLRNRDDVDTMIRSFAGRDKKPVEYVPLKVDLRAAKGIRLHLDPELSRVSVYTTQPIPPNLVSLAS